MRRTVCVACGSDVAVSCWSLCGLSFDSRSGLGLPLRSEGPILKGGREAELCKAALVEALIAPCFPG